MMTAKKHTFTHVGLFEGIGGFSLAAQWAGWRTLAWSEWNEFCQKILKYHFPDAEGFGDITKTDFSKYANKIDVISGGFPCQPYSLAGKRRGKADERHLWPAMLRAIKEIQPSYVVGENVFGLINWDGGLVFDEVHTDLETEGFEVWAYVLPACGVNAPHRRDRVWFVAYSERNSKLRANDPGRLTTDVDDSRADYACRSDAERATCDKGREELSQSKFRAPTVFADRTIKQREYLAQQAPQSVNGSDRRIRINNFQNFPTEPAICGGDDGLPGRLDGITFFKWHSESIKAFGNAIVPQVAFQIFTAINRIEEAPNE